MARIDQTAAAHAVLIELGNVLGMFRDHLVIIGGWVPELLYPERGHIGSLDVDLAVASTALSENAYDTFLQQMLNAGYAQKTNPTHFVKSVPGAAEPVKVDIIAGQYALGQKHASIQLNELSINTVRGLDLAFEACDLMELRGAMPDGVQNSVFIRIVRPEAFILIKAIALNDRSKHKDAYDIAFVLRHHASLTDLSQRTSSLLSNELAQEGYDILKKKFASIEHVGPVWAAREAAQNGEDYEQTRRAAYENAQELFRLADVT
jgi:hypothetical protein